MMWKICGTVVMQKRIRVMFQGDRKGKHIFVENVN